MALGRRSGPRANQVATERGVSQTALSRWLREATTAPGSPPGRLATDAWRALRREVARRRMERAILQTAAAFFANEPACEPRVLQAEQARSPVVVWCRGLVVTRSGV